MIRIKKGFLFRGTTVVFNKEHIMNSTDEDYEKVSVYIGEEEIDEMHAKLMKVREQDEDD